MQTHQPLPWRYLSRAFVILPPSAVGVTTCQKVLPNFVSLLPNLPKVLHALELALPQSLWVLPPSAVGVTTCRKVLPHFVSLLPHFVSLLPHFVSLLL